MTKAVIDTNFLVTKNTRHFPIIYMTGRIMKNFTSSEPQNGKNKNLLFLLKWFDNNKLAAVKLGANPTMIRPFLALFLYFFCVTVTKVESQTEWQKQDCPITADLHNLFFVSDSVGWIITHKTGTVLHTTNGGNTWFVQSQVDSIFLESIYFLDEKNGWISGQYGLLFKTTDGGENWEKQKISKDNSWIYSVYFIGQKQGIAVGLHGGKCPFKPVFLKTNNGGISWNNLETQVPKTGYEPIFFINNLEGFVGGGGYILQKERSRIEIFENR